MKKIITFLGLLVSVVMLSGCVAVVRHDPPPLYYDSYYYNSDVIVVPPPLFIYGRPHYHYHRW